MLRDDKRNGWVPTLHQSVSPIWFADWLCHKSQITLNKLYSICSADKIFTDYYCFLSVLSDFLIYLFLCIWVVAVLAPKLCQMLSIYADCIHEDIFYIWVGQMHCLIIDFLKIHKLLLAQKFISWSSLCYLSAWTRTRSNNFKFE